MGGPPAMQSTIRRTESCSDAMKRCDPDSWKERVVTGALPRMTHPILGPGSVEKSIVHS